MINVRPGLTIPSDEVELRTSRSSGPGGQHANVTASRVEASFDVAASSALSDEQKRRVMARCGPVVRAVAQDTRSQRRNRELALERLAGRLASALTVQRPRKQTRPTRAAKERRIKQKQRRSETKRLRGRPGSEG
ncbi:MAG: ribosome-associated protein [Thermoleophilaceae bacterium]|nr:ribosome-associated protein [Thermoleophilaceae bacterium]